MRFFLNENPEKNSFYTINKHIFHFNNGNNNKLKKKKVKNNIHREYNCILNF